MDPRLADVVESSPDLVLSHLDSLPTLPAVALRLLQLTAQEDSDAHDIVRMLRGDQSLTAKILSVAGSAAVGAREPVTTLEKAVPLLGFAGVRSIVLATGVFDCFGGKREARAGAAFERLEFWKHALGVACATKRLAELRRDKRTAPDDAFVAGLLHDLGKVALDTVFPKAYDRIATQADHSRGDIADSERAVLGVDHTVAGRRLAERWRLPRELQEVIWLHHLAGDALPASVARPALIGLVQLADTLVREQRIGYSGNHVFYEHSPRLAERLGVPAEHLAAVVDSLAADVAAWAKLLELDAETPQAVYVKAMTRANAELGRLNADLAASNRRLAAGARYFRALAEFEQRLADWADPAAVVAALVRAAATAVQRSNLGAFGVRDKGATIDVSVLAGAEAEPHSQTTAAPAELAAWLAEPHRAWAGHVIPAPAAVRQLFVAAWGPAERSGVWLLPIVHQARVTGGIVYASDADEPARFAEEGEELRAFLASLGLALGRANAQAAAQRLSEDLAETNRRLQQVQGALLRSRTLAMIAEMASGAGHELNGPLSVISGRAQMLSARLEDPEVRRALQAISEKAHECSGIVSELMDFARPPTPQPAPVDLHELLSEVRAELLQESGLPAARLRLETPREATAAVVLGDAEQLAIVLRELLRNACDAVSENAGTIVLRYQAALQDDTLEVLVEDSGCGMTPAVLQRAFDPFYSHRAAGRGRGLGLPRAYRISEAHGGRVWLESHPGEGTTAHVLLRAAH